MPKETKEERRARFEKRRQRRKALKELEQTKQDDPEFKALLDARTVAQQEYQTAANEAKAKRQVVKAAQQAIVAALEDLLPDELKNK
jgi:hypothetical protein